MCFASRDPMRVECLEMFQMLRLALLSHFVIKSS